MTKECRGKKRSLSFPPPREFQTPPADAGTIPGSGRSPGEGKWQPTPVCLPGESHGPRRRAGYSPCGHRESDTTEHTAGSKWYILDVASWDPLGTAGLQNFKTSQRVVINHAAVGNKAKFTAPALCAWSGDLGSGYLKCDQTMAPPTFLSPPAAASTQGPTPHPRHFLPCLGLPTQAGFVS